MWVIHPHWNLDSRVTRLNLSVAPVKLEFLLVKSRPRCATSDVVRSPHNLRPCNLESCSHCGAIGDGVGGREGSRKGWHDSSGPHCVCAWKNKEVKERHCERADGLGCVGSEDYFFQQRKTCIRLLLLWFGRAYMVAYTEKPVCMYILITISYLCANYRQIDASLNWVQRRRGIIRRGVSAPLLWRIPDQLATRSDFEISSDCKVAKIPPKTWILSHISPP